MASRVLRTGGLKFDGVDDYVNTPLAVSAPFTVMAWVLPTTFKDYYTELFSQGVSASDRSWNIGQHRYAPYNYEKLKLSILS